jgi:hypothetical protein
MNSKNIVIILLGVVLVAAVAYLLIRSSNETVVVVEDRPSDETMPVEPDGGIGDGAESLDDLLNEVVVRGSESVIGTSVDGEEIIARHFGTGAAEVLLIGGIHGSYSANTAALTEEAIAYFETNEAKIPEGVMLTIIPNLNPDGLAMTGTSGRFNSNDVDLNRNFDCEWSETGMWRQQEVSGGSAPFSEPEAAALRDYVDTYNPNAAVVLFSAEGKVYPSACNGAPSSASIGLAATYATATGYPSEAEFDAYAITGDMVNWMAKEGIPAISVLLTDHENTEWTKNKVGIEAVLKDYAN